MPRRVLRDGGRVAVSVWGDPDQNPWASIPARALIEGALAMLVRALPQAEQAALSGEVGRRLEPYAEGDGYRLPGMCLNVLAA